MSAVAQGWLVYELTGSGFALGWVGAGWSISTLTLSLYGGTVCDRVEKRHLLMIARFGMILNSLILALLISTDVIQLWHLAASSVFTGVLFSFMMPAQSSMLVDLVDRKTLLNANSLNSVGMGLMGIFAASAAGVLIESLGVQSVYFVMAIMYAWALFSLVKLPNTGRCLSGTESVWSDLRDGVRYLFRSPAIVALLSIGLSRVILGMPYRTLMPKYASDVLGLDASGLGILLGAPGVGSLISALVLASMGNLRNKTRLLLVCGIATGLCLLLFALGGNLWVVLLALAGVGATGNACMIANQTLLQDASSDRYRGRIMSMYMMMWGLTPLGTLPAGWIADKTGVAPVIGVQGALLAAILLFVFFFRPRVRELDAGEVTLEPVTQTDTA